MSGPLTPEEQLLWDIFAIVDKEPSMSLDIKQFIRKPFPVDAVQVTDGNINAVAEWCGGAVKSEKQNGQTVPFIKVNVHTPMSDRQTMAYVGDWVLYAGRGYKVYTDKAFRKSFEVPSSPTESVTNVFNSAPIVGGGGGGGSVNLGGTVRPG